MKRRHFINLGLAGLAGCGKEQAKNVLIDPVCPFPVTIPEEWRESAVIEKVPMIPLFSREGWKAYQNDKSLNLKPGYNIRPQHWAIRLPGALPEGIPFHLESAGDNPTAPQILIHKADEWSVVWTDGEYEEDPKIATTLRSMREGMDATLTQDNRRFSPCYVDGSLDFRCLKRRLEFSGGHGVRLVAQWMIEAELMRFGRLHYVFVGMSDDNSVQIVATFPINLPGLPDPDEKNHLGRSLQDYPEFSKSFGDYASDSVKWLEQHADEITPSLRDLDEMIQSIVAPGWKD